MLHIEKLQNWMRAINTRRHFLKLRAGIVRAQALVRGVRARNELRRQHLAALHIQAAWRRYRTLRAYTRLRRIALVIQATWRGRRARDEFARLRASGAPFAISSLTASAAAAAAAAATAATAASAKPTSEEETPKSVFEINRVNTISLNQFDLSNPETLVKFALADDLAYDSDFTEELLSEDDDAFDETAGGSSAAAAGRDDDEVGLNATFILEDRRLKLIETVDKSFPRRQSLATTASTAKVGGSRLLHSL